MKPNMESNPTPLAAIGVDIGKEVFHLVGFGVDGKIAFRRRNQAIVSKTRSRSCRVYRRNGGLFELPFCQQRCSAG